MADLLSHVLVAYVLFTLSGWYIDWLTPRWVVVGMGGAIVPDLRKIQLLVDSDLISQMLGVPFTWGHLSTLGGVLLAAGVIALLFERAYRLRAYILLTAGGLSHLVGDGLRVWADGRASQWLFPFLPSWRPPTPNLYVTSDPVVPLIVVSVAALVFAFDWRRRRTPPAAAPE